MIINFRPDKHTIRFLSFCCYYLLFGKIVSFSMARLILLVGLICHTAILTVLASDPHGGVVMGVSNHHCDDGENSTSIDWDSSSSDEYTCLEGRDLDILRNSDETCEDVAKRPIHVCYPEAISYDEDLPTSGRHRPLWPKYGEYLYLPPQRWLHSLEHGAIVFLYNPCASLEQISTLKALARGCMRRHIISPSKRITPPNMFAVLSWQCKLVMTYVDVPTTVEFVKRHALHSPERSVFANGQYSIGLTHPAKFVTNLEDTEICPRMAMMKETSDLISQRSRQRIELLRKLRSRMEELGDSNSGSFRHFDSGR